MPVRADYGFSHNTWDVRRGRFIAPIADLSAFRAIPDIPLHLFICIIGPNIHQPKLLSRVSSCSPHVCHPERSEASHVRVEMLRCAQDDKTLPNCGAYASAQFNIMLLKPASMQLVFVRLHRVCRSVYPAKAHPRPQRPTDRVWPLFAVVCQ